MSETAILDFYFFTRRLYVNTLGYVAQVIIKWVMSTKYVSDLITLF